jgi:DNA-binding transcriptional LysR family regulator
MPTSPTRIELRHLRYFLAVIEELHFARAAARLHMTQPPLSQAIRKLEDELGVRLLNRTSRVVTPTEAGRVFAEHARSVLTTFDLAVTEARGAGAAARLLRIGCVPSVPIVRVHRFVQALEQRLPSWRAEVVHMSAIEQCQRLVQGDLDLGIFHDAGRVGGIELEALFAGEALVLFLSNDHHLAVKEVLTAHDLRDEVHVTWTRAVDPALHDHLTALYEAAGYRFRDVVQVGDASSRDLMLAVAGGRGVGFGVPSFAADGSHLGIVSHRTVEPPLRMPDTVLAWCANSPTERHGVVAAARELARELRQATGRTSRHSAYQ